jgi:transposase-like protein
MKKQSNGHYPVEFRMAAVEQLKAGVPIGVLAQRLGVHRCQLHRWKKDPVHPERKAGSSRKPGRPPKEFSRPPEELSSSQQLLQLQQALAQKVLEVQFFKGALQKVEARRQRSRNSGALTSTTTSEK